MKGQPKRHSDKACPKRKVSAVEPMAGLAIEPTQNTAGILCSIC